MIVHNGNKYARVSNVIKPFTDFSHIDPDVLQNKCRIGTEVHEAINDEILGTFPILSKDCLGYFVSFEKWKDKLSIEFLASERRYFCDEKKITGQIDALIKFPDEKNPILVDFKTSAQESPIVWPMQAHLYHYLLAKNGYHVSLRFLFVKLDKHGKLPKVFVYKFDNHIKEKCFAAIDTFWKNNSEE